jgi:hypothetical protein
LKTSLATVTADIALGQPESKAKCVMGGRVSSQPRERPQGFAARERQGVSWHPIWENRLIPVFVPEPTLGASSAFREACTHCNIIHIIVIFLHLK